MSGSSDSIIQSVQDFYNQAGVHFSRTRQKKYGSGSSNWVATDQYLAKLKPGDSVLDIGCGNGKLITGLPAGANYVGTDFSETLLAEARALHPEHEFRLGDILATSHWAELGQYSAIFCVAVLHHIPEQQQQLMVLRAARAHLKPGGFLYLTVWNLSQSQFDQYRVGDHYEIPYNNQWMRYCVPFDIPTLTSLFAQAGWEIEEIFYADQNGLKADVKNGKNLVVVAK